MGPLVKSSPGKYKIVQITTACQAAKKRLMMLGVLVGDEIELIKPSPGPVIIEKGGTRIGLGQGMASCIIVNKITKETR